MNRIAPNELLFTAQPEAPALVLAGASGRAVNDGFICPLTQLRVNSPLTPVPDSTTAVQPSDDDPSRFRR